MPKITISPLSKAKFHLIKIWTSSKTSLTFPASLLWRVNCISISRNWRHNRDWPIKLYNEFCKTKGSRRSHLLSVWASKDLSERRLITYLWGRISRPTSREFLSKRIRTLILGLSVESLRERKRTLWALGQQLRERSIIWISKRNQVTKKAHFYLMNHLLLDLAL